METKRNAMNFKLDEFSTTKEVEWNFHINESDVSTSLVGYVIIIDLDLMRGLCLIINCKIKVVECDEIKIPMTSKTMQLNGKQLHALLLSTK